MQEANFNDLNNFISGWFIEKKVCDDIVKYHSNHEQKKGIFYTLDGQSIVDETIKKSIDVNLDPNDEIFNDYFQELLKCVNKYIEQYPACNMYQKFGLNESVNIQKYEPNGGYYPFHCERGSDKMPSASRHLVFITYLNDVDDEGQTEFLHQKMKVKPRKGLTVIFPADWTFTHRGIPSPTQEKIIVTGWLNYI